MSQETEATIYDWIREFSFAIGICFSPIFVISFIGPSFPELGQVLWFKITGIIALISGPSILIFMMARITVKDGVEG